MDAPGVRVPALVVVGFGRRLCRTVARTRAVVRAELADALKGTVPFNVSDAGRSVRFGKMGESARIMAVWITRLKQ